MIAVVAGAAIAIILLLTAAIVIVKANGLKLVAAVDVLRNFDNPLYGDPDCVVEPHESAGAGYMDVGP